MVTFYPLPPFLIIISTFSLFPLFSPSPSPPYLLLNEFPVPLLYQFVQCTAGGILHGYHQRLLFNERRIVSNNVWMLGSIERTLTSFIANFLSSGGSSSTGICFVTTWLLFARFLQRKTFLGGCNKTITCVTTHGRSD